MSLGLGALSSTIALALSVPAALAIARYRFPGRDALSALLLSPLMIPHVVLGIAFLRFFTQIGLDGTFTGLVLAHVVIVFPFALRLVLASAIGMDRAIEQAAISLGASRLDRVPARHAAADPARASSAAGCSPSSSSFDEVTMTVFIAAPGTDDAAGAHVPLHPGQHRSAGHLGLGERDRGSR